MHTYKENWCKYIIGFVVCLLIRLVPFRPANIEPILATQMPFSKAYGKVAGCVFAFLSIVLFDVVTKKVGVWTLITALAYGLLGVWASYFFRKRKSTPMNYAGFAILATLAYDAVTGLSIGPLFFHQTFISALVGQIPFTILHLAGNICFALILSPVIYRFVIQNKHLESRSLLAHLHPKRL